MLSDRELEREKGRHTVVTWLALASLALEGLSPYQFSFLFFCMIPEIFSRENMIHII